MFLFMYKYIFCKIINTQIYLEIVYTYLSTTHITYITNIILKQEIIQQRKLAKKEVVINVLSKTGTGNQFKKFSN